MANIEDYKIKVISGINDVPLEPNYSGNGKGCNGAFYTERHNKLTDLIFLFKEGLKDNLITADIEKDLPDERFLLEIGTEFLESGDSLRLTYEIIEDVDLNRFTSTAHVYFGTNLNSLSPASPPISPEDVWTYYPTEYSIIPNIEYAIKTYYFQIQGNIDDILNFKTPSIALKWIPKAFFGLSTQDNILDPEDVNINIFYTSLGMPNNLTVPETPSQGYLYLFIPKHLPEYPEIKFISIELDSTPIPLTIVDDDHLLTVTSEGTGTYDHNYIIYRTTDPYTS